MISAPCTSTTRSPRMPRRQPVMHDLGIDDLVLVGACFSARTALSAAPSIRGVRAVVMATPPVGGYGREDAMAERLSREWSWSDDAKSGPAGDADQPGQPSHRQAYTRFARFKLRGGCRPPGRRPHAAVGEPETACSPGDHGGSAGSLFSSCTATRTCSSVNGEGQSRDGSGPFLQSAGDLVDVVDDFLGWCTASLGSASRTVPRSWRSTGSGQRCPPPARADGEDRGRGDQTMATRSDPQASPKKPTVTVSACSISPPTPSRWWCAARSTARCSATTGEVLLSRRLAAAGAAVERFHYRGTGNSTESRRGSPWRQ